MNPFLFSTTKTLVFRPGAAADLAAVAGALLGPRVLVVTDPGLRKLGLCDARLPRWPRGPRLRCSTRWRRTLRRRR